jgi:hypothetical protein
MAITQVITALPTAPDPLDPATFSTRAAASVLAQKAMVPEINTWTEQVNAIVSGTAGDIASGINGATAKTTPVDADLMCLTDSASSFSLKKLTWANLKATLGVTFAALAGSAAQVFSVAAATAAAHAIRLDQLSTGWVPDPNTWTYASASSFTIAGDHTATFTKGAKISWFQTSTRYGHVVSSSVASGTTTVNITVNTSYVIADATITVPKYSYAGAPSGFPSLFAYTSTITGCTVGTVTLYYTLTGGLCTVYTNTFGLLTSNAAGFTATAPFACVALHGNVVNRGGLIVLDNGAWQTVSGIASVTNASNVISFGLTGATATANAFAGFTTSGTKACEGLVIYPI